MAGPTGSTRTLTVNNQFKSKLYQKKVAKVESLKAKDGAKKFKKMLVGRLFKEDLDSMSKIQRTEYKRY